MFRTRGVLALALSVLVALALFTAVRLYRDDGASSGSDSGPQGLQSTLETLRDPWGMFVDPTYYDGAGSIYSTALVDSALGTSLPFGEDAHEAAKAACASSERDLVRDPWFSWALVTALGKEGLLCAVQDLPPRTGDPTTDVPQSYAWAVVEIAAGTSIDDVAQAVRPVLGEGVSDVRSPYVMWRLDQLEQLLGLPSTASSRPAEGPTSLQGPDDLTELWGYTMRCEAHRDLCRNSEPITDEEVAIAAVSYPDDLSLAGAISVLRARSSGALLATLTRDVDARRVTGTGLIRGSRFLGTIDATYAVLQLAPALFPGELHEITSVELLRRLRLIPPTDTAKRLRALAILKAVDPAAWQAFRPEIDSVFAASNGAQVTKDSVLSHAGIATAFGVMGIDTPMAHLTLFEPEGDEDRFIALSASADAWAFSNGDDILLAYRDLRADALAQAQIPKEPIASYVVGLRALNGQGLSVTQDERNAISSALDQRLRGCTLNSVHTTSLFRFNLDASSACSLLVTNELVRSSFASTP